MWIRLRRYFISGLVILLPLVLTVYVFLLTVGFADGLLGKYIKPIFERNEWPYYPGMGIILTVILVTIIGFFVTNFLGRTVYSLFERILMRLPFFRQVYPAMKEIAMFIFSRERSTFQQVVILEYPRKGIYSFGFITNDTSRRITEKLKTELVNVFVPSAPGPLTGYIVMIPRKDLTFPDMTVEEAVKLIVSGGVVNPVMEQIP